jgi:hypothetical protein
MTAFLWRDGEKQPIKLFRTQIYLIGDLCGRKQN